MDHAYPLDLYWNYLECWYVDCPCAPVDWVGRHLAHYTPKSAHHRWAVGGVGLAKLVEQLGLKRRVTLLRSEAGMPLTWGIVRPQVLIPADAENWSSAQQRAVLLHELAHVQRWDWLTQTLANIFLRHLLVQPAGLGR